MTSSWNGRIYDANKNSGKHFEIMWDAGAWIGICGPFPRRSAHGRRYKFIAFAVGGPQAGRRIGSPMVPATRTRHAAGRSGDPAGLPTAPDHMTNALLTSPEFWGDKGDDLRQRFTAWLAQ
jgi:putative spermidine/putrescine transport system substrate-binding protein